MRSVGRFALCAIVICALASAPALAGKWQKLGSDTVYFKADRDVIEVKDGNGDTACSQIKLKVNGQWLVVTELKVFFKDGSSQDVELNESIRPGTESAPIDIDGGAQAIEKVEIAYQKRGIGNSGYAQIALWGLPG